MKKTVNFRRDKEARILNNNTAYLFPINHPDSSRVSNTKYAYTSEVLDKFHDQEGFLIYVETKNTFYVAVDKKDTTGVENKN